MAISQSETSTADVAAAAEEPSAEVSDAPTTALESGAVEAETTTTLVVASEPEATTSVAPSTTTTTTIVTPSTTTAPTSSTSSTSTTSTSTRSSTTTTSTTAAPTPNSVAPTPVVAPLGRADAATEVEVFEDQPHPGNVVFFDGSFLRLDDYSKRRIHVERSDNGVDWVREATVGLPRDSFVQELQANANGLVVIAETLREKDFVDPFELIQQLGLVTEDQLNNNCGGLFEGAAQPITVTVCDFEAIYEAEQAFWEAIDVPDISDEEFDRLSAEFEELIDELYEGEEILRLEPGDEFHDQISDAFLAERAFYEDPYDRLLATSTDGTNWETADLPEIELDPGAFEYIVGSATSGDQVVALVSIDPGYFDPNWLLFEEGLITEDQLDNFCDITFDGEGSPIVVSVCDLEALYEAEEAFWAAIDIPDISQDEVARLSEEFYALQEMLLQGEEILRLEPGDELYDELAAGFLARPRAVALAGTAGSAFQVVDVPGIAHPNAVVGTEAGFLVTGYDEDFGALVVLQSTDGLTWSSAERAQELADEVALANAGQLELVANEDVTLAVVYEFASGDESVDTRVLVSDDLGDTWEENAIPTELFGTYAQTVAGPAGFATLLEGTVEPAELGPDLIEIEREGFVMQWRVSRDRIRLSSADGTLIHEPVQFEDIWETGEIAGVVRLSRNGNNVVWLDPETGEDLVVFSLNALDNAYFAAIDEFYAEEEFEPVVVAAELWFSADGETWELLEAFDPEPNVDQSASLVAVGDDEVLVSVQSWMIPTDDLFAFEEEGRDPTAAEIQAIDDFFENADRSDLVRVEVAEPEPPVV